MMKINGTAISFDVINGNGRSYEKESLNIETLEEILKSNDIFTDNDGTWSIDDPTPH